MLEAVSSRRPLLEVLIVLLYPLLRVGVMGFLRVLRNCGVLLEYFLVMVVPLSKALGVLLSS